MLKLHIRTKNSEGNAPLFFKLKIEGVATYVKLHMEVDIQEWKEVSKSEKKLSNYLNKKKLTQKLIEIESAIYDLRQRHKLTKDTVKQVIENVVLAEKRAKLLEYQALKDAIVEKQKGDVRKFVVSYIDSISKGEVRTEKGEKYTPNSIKIMKQFRRIFLVFYDKKPFTWDEINKGVIDRYIEYLQSECGYMKSTCERYITVFRTLVRVAEKEKVHTNHIAKSVFHIPTVKEQDKKKEIFLTVGELDALYNMELKGKEELVRDVFLIGCYTGQRFSDYSKIEPSNIRTTNKGTRVVDLIQVKTQSQVVVPILDDRLDVLLKKYDYNIPNVSDVVLNRYIKNICKRLAETEPTLAVKERTLLTKTEKEMEKKAKKDKIKLFEYDCKGFVIKPRWQLVSSHTARRTAITNMVLSKKWTDRQMMEVSGHKKYETFNKYVKLSLDDIADEIANSAENESLF